MQVKKRFIAGARCMRCNAMDKVMMLTSVDDEWIECVECGYTERRPTEVVTNSPSKTNEIGVVQFKPSK